MKNNVNLILLCVTAVALHIISSDAVQIKTNEGVAPKANGMKPEPQPTPITNEEGASPADGSTTVEFQPISGDTTPAIEPNTTTPNTTVPTTPPTTNATTTPTPTPTNTTTTPITPTPPTPANTTTIPTPTTTVPSNTTNSTTVSPTTPPTIPTSTNGTMPTSQATTVKPTAAPSTSDRRFDGPSFIGGIVLSFGIMAIGFVAWKFYKARTERNYHTL